MKKIIMALGLAASLVLASAVSAMAATPLNQANKSYDPTPAGSLYTTPQTANYGATNNNPDYYGYSAAQDTPSGAPTKGGDVGPVAGMNKDVTRIHSNYASNTNACAACHATHTGVGEDLLQWDGETTTCMACHDGTAGVATYNVAGGKIGASDQIANGGLFPTATDGANSKSMHDVFGGLEVNAAPGGNFADPTTDANVPSPANQTAAVTQKGKWNNEFNCVSCHDPHGNGGNFRILNPNVNGFANVHTDKTAFAWNVIPAPGDITGLKYVVKASFKDVNSTAPFYAYLLQGPYPIKVGITANSAATVDNSKGYTEITLAASQTTAPTVSGNVAAKVKGSVTNYLQDTEKVTYINGFSDFCGACHTDYNTSNVTVTNDTNAYGDRVNYRTTTFQPATDGRGGPTMYQDEAKTIPVYTPSHAVSVQTGTFTSAYRHTVGLNAGSDGHGNAANGMPFETRTYYETKNGTATTTTQYYLSCLSCHVAHGTDNKWWQAYATQRGEWGVPVGQTDAAGDTVSALSDDAQAIYNTSEVFDTTNSSSVNNRGSNLKRMPNMAACEGCHGKGAGNEGYSATYAN